MLKRLCVGTAIAAFLSFGAPSLTFAQDQTTPKQDVKKAGKETKKAGQDAGDAAKDAGKATAKATKKTAKSVKHKVTPNMTSATCKDGTVQRGHTKTTACNGHGGVASGQ
ncbi:MAG TPA: hypothetical protein VFA59_07445 [Vicinamibacterales bacterium]|nr:hypothetical protein [Vicinamibacterales bacterium]